MKKLTLTLIILSVSQFLYAQWTTNGNNIYNTNSGNVGIGINSTVAKFAVYQSAALGSVAKNNLLLSSVAGSAANNVQHNIWLVRNTAGSDFTTARLHDGISIDASCLTPQTDTRTWWERDPTGDVQSWGTAGNTYMSIVQGNIAIGTTDTKGYKFAVNGSVIANSITVKVYPWADFVFKKDYQLPSLTEVKAYIDQNNHLPEIPSEAEVVKNGLNLGEMNRLLLKKVEELTLYLVEQDSERERQAKQLALQRQEITSLSRRVKALARAGRRK